MGKRFPPQWIPKVSERQEQVDGVFGELPHRWKKYLLGFDGLGLGRTAVELRVEGIVRLLAEVKDGLGQRSRDTCLFTGQKESKYVCIDMNLQIFQGLGLGVQFPVW